MTDFMTAPGLGLTDNERILIRDMAQDTAGLFGPRCLMVNIGVALGGTLWCLRAGAPGAHIIGLDVDPNSARGEWEFYHADSRQFHRLVDTPVHLLLVDGDHDYYGVKADILNWTPKVVSGGVVLFHDYGNGEMAPHTAGVKRAVDELMNGEWNHVADADSMRVFRKN